METIRDHKTLIFAGIALAAGISALLWLEWTGFVIFFAAGLTLVVLAWRSNRRHGLEKHDQVHAQNAAMYLEVTDLTDQHHVS